MHYIYYLYRRVEVGPGCFMKEVVYVGRSKNVKARVSAHKNTKKFDSFEILDVTSELGQAKEMEDSYIMHYNPIYNRCLNKSGLYRKMQEILDEHEIDKNEFGEFANLLIKRKVKPVFKDNYSPHEINNIVSIVKNGYY